MNKAKQLRPVIGITLDSEETGGYSKFPWYALRQNYCSSLTQFGAIPLPLTHEMALLDEYNNLIDGLVITGGDFDIDPSLYGDSTRHAKVTTKNLRTEFEFAMTRKMLQSNRPVLGICGGQQALNVILGGTLIQHIPDEVNTKINHEQVNPRNEPSHYVKVEQNSLLHKITNKTKLFVNSAHHQAVKAIGKNVVVNATAEDGVIEGIESKEHPFCLGVQWHPEFLIDEGDSSIFREFVDAARKSKNS